MREVRFSIGVLSVITSKLHDDDEEWGGCEGMC
jgi:hypothetical protein